MSREIQIHSKIQANYGNFVDWKRSQYETEESYRKEMEYEANIDPLTGVFNRGTISEILGRQLYRLRNGEIGGVTVVIADMDDLKRINDKYNHKVGDEAIKHASNALLDSVRVDKNNVENGRRIKTKVGDFVCRYGGDEFFLITGDDIDEHDSVILVSDIPARIREVDARSKKTADYKVRFSTGAAFTDSYVPLEELWGHADETMYLVKKKRKGGRTSVLWTREGIKTYKWGRDGFLYEGKQRVKRNDGSDVFSNVMVEDSLIARLFRISR
jgi:diguanylate cyclase (GGDEF)-like protein